MWIEELHISESFLFCAVRLNMAQHIRSERAYLVKVYICLDLRVCDHNVQETNSFWTVALA